MSRLPAATDTLASLPIATLQTVAEKLWVRISALTYASAEYYSRSLDNRFTSPTDRFGVMSLADTDTCALGETICRNAALKRENEKVVSWAQLEALGLYDFELTSNALVLDFTVANLARYRLDERINAERIDGRIPPYEYGPAWSDHAYDLGLAGIRYRSRHSHHHCLALFEGRAACTHTLRTDLTDHDVLEILETTFDWGVI